MPVLLRSPGMPLRTLYRAQAIVHTAAVPPPASRGAPYHSRQFPQVAMLPRCDYVGRLACLPSVIEPEHHARLIAPVGKRRERGLDGPIARRNRFAPGAQVQ